MSDPHENQEAELEEELPPDEDEGGEEDATPEDEGEAEEEAPHQDAEPEALARPRKKSASDTIRELRRQTQTEREARIRAEAEATARRNMPDPGVAARQAAEEAEEQRLVAQMTPQEKAQYLLAREVRDTRNNTARLEARMADSADESRFLARYGNDPRFKDYLDDVEQRVGGFRNQGIPFQREAILKFLIGERALSAPAKKAGTMQRRAAAERVATARGNTVPARSNARSGGARGGSLVARMEQSDGAV